MKKIVFGSMLLVLAASFPAFAGGSLQVLCEDEDTGAEVFINGKPVGGCPVEVPVTADSVQVRVRKSAGADYEAVFATTLKVTGGGVHRLELVLPEPQLTVEARQKKEAAELAALLDAAKKGNVAAMRKVAQRYDTGAGVVKDPAQAADLRKQAEVISAKAQLQAANAGDLEAMKYMAIRYDMGFGVEKDPAQAKVWREKALAAKR